MRGINLLILFAVLTSYLDSINGAIVVPFPRINQGYKKVQKPEQINSEDDLNEIEPEVPFPRPRTVNYLKDMSEEAKDKERMDEEIKDIKSIQILNLEQNFDTVIFNRGNIAEQIFTTAAPRDVKMQTSKPFFERNFPSLFRYLNSRHSKNQEKLEKEEKEAKKQNTSEIYPLNDTEVAKQKPSTFSQWDALFGIVCLMILISIWTV